MVGLAFLLWLSWPTTNTLMGQAARGDVDGARWSMRLGVDPNGPARYGFRHENLGQTPLTAAAQFGQVEVARLLLSKGADPNLRDGGGLSSTPLATAARHGQLEMCRVLLDAGADPNLPSNPQLVGEGANWTALDWALQANHAAIADLLRQRGGVENRRR
jgi:ankyrin repeat protein